MGSLAVMMYDQSNAIVDCIAQVRFPRARSAWTSTPCRLPTLRRPGHEPTAVSASFRALMVPAVRPDLRRLASVSIAVAE
jgi:hypothetical protein